MRRERASLSAAEGSLLEERAEARREVAWSIFWVVSSERSTRSSSWPPEALPEDASADILVWFQLAGGVLR